MSEFSLLWFSHHAFSHYFYCLLFVFHVGNYLFWGYNLFFFWPCYFFWLISMAIDSSCWFCLQSSPTTPLVIFYCSNGLFISHTLSTFISVSSIFHGKCAWFRLSALADNLFLIAVCFIAWFHSGMKENTGIQSNNECIHASVTTCLNFDRDWPSF